MEIKNKTILITGANGLVGIPTIEKCISEGASTIVAADIIIGAELLRLQLLYPDIIKLEEADLTRADLCQKLFTTYKINVVLHIAGIKGSPTRTKTKPADYLIPMLQFNTNIMNCSFNYKVDWFVYLSSVGVYAPADVMEEDSVWKTFPSQNDWHPGWAKRMGELVLDSLKIQHGWDNWTIIRPSNIYGVNDNFAPDATVVSSNIWKLYNIDSDDIVCWGNGSARRDFVFGDDVAQATIDVVKKEVRDTINFGCGEAVSIKDTIETLISAYTAISGKTKKIVWDETKPNGDLLRCLSSEKQKKYDILPKTSLYDGLKKTLENYHKRMHNHFARDMSLKSKGYYVGNVDELIPDANVLSVLSNMAYEYAKPEFREQHFRYRLDIAGVPYDQNTKNYIPISLVKPMKQHIKDSNSTVAQCWYESINLNLNSPILEKYTLLVIKKLASILYPDTEMNNIHARQSLTLYEEGDFIDTHRDGKNQGRLCIVLLYLTNPEKFIDSGGKLIIKDENVYDEVEPVMGNYVVLEYAENDIIHAVEPVKNGQRLCILAIVEDRLKTP